MFIGFTQSAEAHEADYQFSARDVCTVFKFWLIISWNKVCSRRDAEQNSSLDWIYADVIFIKVFALSFKHICGGKAVLFCGYSQPPKTCNNYLENKSSNPKQLKLKHSVVISRNKVFQTFLQKALVTVKISFILN